MCYNPKLKNKIIKRAERERYTTFLAEPNTKRMRIKMQDEESKEDLL
jgi:hypothetical protein